MVLGKRTNILPNGGFNSDLLLLMEEIRRSPVEVGSLSHYSQGFIHPRCKISAINKYHPWKPNMTGEKSTTNEDVSPTTNGVFSTVLLVFGGGELQWISSNFLVHCSGWSCFYDPWFCQAKIQKKCQVVGDECPLCWGVVWISLLGCPWKLVTN